MFKKANNFLSVKLTKETIIEEEDDVEKARENQIVICGTAFYDFNHFSEYWMNWRQIILSRGEEWRLREIFGDDEIPSDFDWRHYSIIRVPYDLLPEGFMDASQVARSKATVHAGIYQMEFGACFSTDSQGFFKRSLIESCVVTKDNPITHPSGPVMFNPLLKGDPNCKYVFGIDPASEVDNFSIVVLEIHPDHRRIVHCWTTNRSRQKEQVKAGLANETDFYSHCARKIRDLMNLYIEKINQCVYVNYKLKYKIKTIGNMINNKAANAIAAPEITS